MKGLQRSISRGPKTIGNVVVDRIPVNVVVPVAAAGAAIGFGTAVVHDLPAGHILFLGAGAALGFAGSGSDANLGATWSGDFSIGTAPTVDADLADAGEASIIPAQALDTAEAQVHAAAVYTSTTTKQGAIFDNSDGALEVNLNLLIDAADIVDSASVDITVAGQLTVAYIVL